MLNPIICLQDVFLVRNHQTILKGISWTIRKGQHWAVIGSNGAGKTSLLKIIAGYLWPSKGEVTVLGKRYGSYDLRELRKMIGWVSDELMEDIYPSQQVVNTVISGKYASIGLWEIPQRDEYKQATRLLEKMRISHLAQRPFGSLSQGEKKRVIIARALMAKPVLLVLDEPFSGLDLGAREEFLFDLERVCPLATLVFVTHHVEEIAPLFSHVLLLKEGQVLAQGEKGKVLTDDLLSHTFGFSIHVRRRFGRYWPIIDYSTKSSQE